VFQKNNIKNKRVVSMVHIFTELQSSCSGEHKNCFWRSMTISKCNLVRVKKNHGKVYRAMGTFNTHDTAILAFLVHVNMQSVSRTYC